MQRVLDFHFKTLDSSKREKKRINGRRWNILHSFSYCLGTGKEKNKLYKQTVENRPIHIKSNRHIHNFILFSVFALGMGNSYRTYIICAKERIAFMLCIITIVTFRLLRRRICTAVLHTNQTYIVLIFRINAPSTKCREKKKMGKLLIFSCCRSYKNPFCKSVEYE